MKHERHAVGQQRGVSLIELMVALIIGLFLIFGAVTVYQQSRTTFRTTEAVARLQEVARLAMDVIESDVRMANYWGLSNEADYIINRAGPGQTPQEPFASLAANVDYCGGDDSNWAINLAQYIGGTNDGYDLECDSLQRRCQCDGGRTGHSSWRREPARHARREPRLHPVEPHPGHSVHPVQHLHEPDEPNLHTGRLRASGVADPTAARARLLRLG